MKEDIPKTGVDVEPDAPTPSEQTYQRRPFTFDRTVRIFFTICVTVAALFLIDYLKGVLLPFVVACLISYILEPVVKWNMRVLHLRRRFFLSLIHI